MYDRQTELAKDWIDGQTQLANTRARRSATDINPLADAAALAELWRSWTALGGSLGRTLPGVSADGGSRRKRLADHRSVRDVLAGGGSRGQHPPNDRRPRFADIGAAEHRMTKPTSYGLRCRPARTYERVVAGAWMTANQLRP